MQGIEYPPTKRRKTLRREGALSHEASIDRSPWGLGFTYQPSAGQGGIHDFAQCAISSKGVVSDFRIRFDPTNPLANLDNIFPCPNIPGVRDGGDAHPRGDNSPTPWTLGQDLPTLPESSCSLPPGGASTIVPTQSADDIAIRHAHPPPSRQTLDTYGPGTVLQKAAGDPANRHRSCTPIDAAYAANAARHAPLNALCEVAFRQGCNQGAMLAGVQELSSPAGEVRSLDINGAVTGSPYINTSIIPEDDMFDLFSSPAFSSL